MTQKGIKVIAADEDVVHDLSMDLIDEPHEAARHNLAANGILELAESIASNGLLQPITLKRNGKRYEIIYGHRRFLAHRHLHRPTIRAIVVNWPEKKVIAARLVENIDREGITPTDIATQLMRLKKAGALTNQDIAKMIGKSQSFVSDHLKIMEYPPVLRDALANNQISFSVAREFAKIEDEVYLRYYLEQAINNGVTPLVARMWVQDAQLSLARQQQLPEIVRSSATIPELPPNGRDCGLCNKFKPFAQLTSLWVCHKCLRELGEINEEMREKPSREEK
jgi:ParB family chromosome partitioning protein